MEICGTCGCSAAGRERGKGERGGGGGGGGVVFGVIKKHPKSLINML